MMHRRAAMAMMVVAEVMGRGGMEEPPIIIGDVLSA
jgi:hypothetical protein